MLIIRRRVGERIVIGSNIEVTVASASKRVVRLAIAAPKGIPVLRHEVHEAVVAANRAATEAMLDMESIDEDDEENEAPDSHDVVPAPEESSTTSTTSEAPTRVANSGAADQEMRT